MLLIKFVKNNHVSRLNSVNNKTTTLKFKLEENLCYIKNF